MNKNPLIPALFFIGLVPACWIGAGYLGNHPLGVLVALLILACYLTGGIELHRYRQASATLAVALAQPYADASPLASWLQPLHPGIRNAVRMRIENERSALPAPALTPYLVGLLVLLGMLGTLLGMMATLRGTGLALETATDLEAIRGSLAAPVQGLGFTFGTSIAGVASSAMLGLVSALCRRERLQLVQQLDTAIAGPLRAHSLSHQREQAFELQQQQAALLPALVERLEAIATGIARQGADNGEQLAARQQEFHQRTEAAYVKLAEVLQQSLQAGVEKSARAVGDIVQPAVQQTLDGLARETTAIHASVGAAVQQQLDALSNGFSQASEVAASSWQAALAEQQRNHQALAGELQQTLQQFSTGFSQQSTELLAAVSQQLDSGARQLAEAGDTLLAQQRHAHAELADAHAQAQQASAARFGEYAASLVEAVEQSQLQLQQALAAQDGQRLAAWSDQLASTSATLREDWQQAGNQTAQLQQQICDALASTARDITAQAQRHASQTIAEISQLVQSASEAPRAAAEVIAELRQQLSDSMVRDTGMLEERNQLMDTLQTLMGAINHASSEQRTAIDALVATSADLLERVGNRFSDHIEGETGKLGEIAAQVAVGASEVASLGESLGASVQLFGHSNEQLLARLQSIETALDKSMARSDEQLAYYVAQAREVIDLNLLSQRQIMADLQQLAGRDPAAADAEAA
ncbi:DUF802 domain-containing protein [Pseudoxanthomonas dokdonensis]|uniref:Membrane protein n=1 Tax=Pseudoxanthomonas dokdonensis TaxID=344882 RepID=A0A0R0CFC0_9GAMM|nr:DUF802 domain-containing protein [Pseudoxanthomonas dokdonensis]KRG68473.1 membrane protein [Pseudoxanthomonas dokdonensis]